MLSRGGSENSVPIISLAGLSGSGKTTAISGVIPRLKKVGLKNISVVKSVSGEIDMSVEPTLEADRTFSSATPGASSPTIIKKDSQIFRASGASAVVLVSYKEGKIFSSDSESRMFPITLFDSGGKTLAAICSEVLPSDGKTDLVIAEGFSADDSIPHIQVGRLDGDRKISGKVLAVFPSLKSPVSSDDEKTINRLAAWLYVFYAILSPRPVLLFVGNPLRGDDGFGASIADIVIGCRGVSDEEVLMINSVTAPENYAARITSFRPTAIVIFDAVTSDIKGGAGDVNIFTPEDILQGAVKFSTHGGGLKMFLDYIKIEMGDAFPPCAVVGAKAESVSYPLCYCVSSSSVMSPEVSAAAQDIAGFILKAFHYRRLKITGDK